MIKKINNNLFHTKCPICGDSKITIAFELKYSDNVEYSSTKIELQLLPELWECKNCKSYFTQNAITEKDSMQLYKNSEAGKRWDAQKFDKEKTKYTVEIFKKYLDGGKTVLDIGCNTGEFLDFAKANGAKTYGFEYSTKSIDLCAKKGHIMLENLTYKETQFDVITAFDLVEHLYDTNEFFNNVNKLLKPNGKLIIFTGDIECWAFSKCKGKWWYLNYPEHVIFISSYYYKYILENFSLEKTYHTYNNKYFKNLNFTSAAIYNYTKMLGLRKGLRPYEGLPSPSPDHIIAVLNKT